MGGALRRQPSTVRGHLAPTERPGSSGHRGLGRRPAKASRRTALGDTARGVSEENLEIVRSLQPSGVDLVEVAGESAGLPTMSYRGVQGFIEGWRVWLAAWDSYRIETEDFVDDGDKVVVPVRVHARTRRDPVEMEHAPAAVWTLARGKVVRIELYLNRAEALKAAGLSHA
jgi:ketosteroid isomerase-like protein